MLGSPHEIYVAAIASALIMLFLITVITVSVVRYQNRYRTHIREISELKNAYDQELLKAQLEIREQTLHGISQEIHDNVGQVLSLAKLHLNKFILSTPASFNERVTTSKDLISKAIHDLRSISKSLNREYIADQSLSQLLQVDLENIKNGADYIIDFKVNGTERPINPQHQLIIYRIAQEALNNIVKHSGASSIEVLMQYDSESFRLAIRDNGIGFEVDKAKAASDNRAGSGVHNMRNRAKLIGGSFVFESNPGKGSMVGIVLPLQ